MTTSPTRPNPIIRFLPSLTDVAFLMPLLFLFIRLDGVKTMLGDGDTGWHIRTGQWILSHHTVPVVDMFSYTKPGQPWFAWEWLWDVSFALLYQRGGLAAVVLGSIVVLCVTFGLLYRLVRRRCGNPILAIAATVAACAVSSIHWLARPHLFTMLFLVIFLLILDRVDHDGRVKLLWWLPVLSVPWTNLHGGFLLGILVLFAYIGGELAAALFTADSEVRSGALHRAKLYAYTTGGCALASLVNPYGWNLWTHLYEYLMDPFQYKYITEFFSFNFHSPLALWVEVMMSLGILAGVWYATKGKFIPLVLLGGLLHISLFAVRNLPLFMIAAAPLVASGVEEWIGLIRQAQVAAWLRGVLGTFEEIGQEILEIDVHWRVYAVSIASILLLGLILHTPIDKLTSIKLRAEYDPARYPAKALDMMIAKHIGNRIFTDDEWGDYVVYRLYPRPASFVDGRSDFYGGTFDEKYLDVMNVKFGWEDYLKQYRVDAILLSTTSPLAGAIKESSNWRSIYDDTVAIVFTPRVPAAVSGDSQVRESAGVPVHQASQGRVSGGFKYGM